MDSGRLALAGVGSLATIAGLVILTRRQAGAPARYARRIAGTMLLAFGGASLLLVTLLTRAQALELLP
ncbi:MAG: hypothetical protein RL671_57 [Pseudomonadota bacterium]|jgi:uncharacterized membrane protein|uniref:hypothetical protein n=1 Tax=Novosphingobium sp. APW14 TaxID=3077237 RepID=UPI0028DFB123|nr:hypothetical protein [Novosphingobium sp. APW14]MDT9013784.1 hypothetical protein [Novosphingobium sp. APW14]